MTMTKRDSWLAWRHEGIGASDCPIIMGVSPWSTPFKLYMEKSEPFAGEKPGGFITDMGNEFEPRVRALVEIMHGETFTPCLVEMKDFNFIRASLDGWTECKQTVLEIKLSGYEDWADTKHRGIVPAKYYPQIQHQLMVTQSKECLYASYLYTQGDNRHIDETRLATVIVKPDLEYIEKIFKAECDFWTRVQSKIPPPLSDGDYKELRVKGARALVAAWRKAKEKIAEYEDKEKDLREQILKLVDHPRMKCGNVTISQVAGRAGAIDYKKAIESLGVEIDLEKFRGEPGKPTWRIK